MATKELTKKVSEEIVVKALEKQARPILSRLNDFVVNRGIKNPDDRAQAMDLTKRLKALNKEAERQRDEIIDPLLLSIKKIKDFFNPFHNQVKNTEALIKQAVLAYDETLVKKKVRLDEDFDKGKIGTRGYLNKSAALEVTDGTRMIWTAIPLDITKTPREFLIPDEAKIKQALKEGKTVQGWEWKQIKTLAI